MVNRFTAEVGECQDGSLLIMMTFLAMEEREKLYKRLCRFSDIGLLKKGVIYIRSTVCPELLLVIPSSENLDDMVEFIRLQAMNLQLVMARVALSREDLVIFERLRKLSQRRSRGITRRPRWSWA